MKDLKEMSLEELWELFPIRLSEPRQEWKIWAHEEIAVLSEDMASIKPAISHIGSTAVEGLIAKPIVDLLVEVDREEFSLAAEALEQNGYICMAESAQRMSFNKGYTPAGFAEKVFHVHLRRRGDNDEILFCDYLRRHVDVAKEYESLKLGLLTKYEHDRDGYTASKTTFVKRVMEMAKSTQAAGRF